MAVPPERLVPKPLRKRRGWRDVAGVVVIVGVVFAGVGVGRAASSLWQRLLLLPRARLTEYEPTFRRAANRELILIYIGKASCAFCRDPAVPKLVKEAKRLVKAHADSLSVGFATVALGLDLDPFVSLPHLNDLGLFDELTLGRGWDNRVALELFHTTVGAEAATPQLLVLRRQVVQDSTYAPTRKLVSEELLFRAVGLDDMHRWVGRGCPLPLEFEFRSSSHALRTTSR